MFLGNGGELIKRLIKKRIAKMKNACYNQTQGVRRCYFQAFSDCDVAGTSRRSSRYGM